MKYILEGLSLLLDTCWQELSSRTDTGDSAAVSLMTCSSPAVGVLFVKGKPACWWIKCKGLDLG